jgi:hypothetical protein
LRKRAVADLLYEDLFNILAGGVKGFLGDGLVDKSLAETPNIKSEWFCLVAFLITFSFQREFKYLGQETSKLILDFFHDRLLEKTEDTVEVNRFSKQLKARYREYYPILKEDFKCLGIEGTIVFGGVTNSFLSKIAPDRSRSAESLLFSPALGELYSTICRTYDKIKEYKIA